MHGIEEDRPAGAGEKPVPPAQVSLPAPAPARPMLPRAMPAAAEPTPPTPPSAPTPPTRPAVDIKGLTRRFGERTALRDVTVQLATNQTLAILGHNGAGKSTLLRI